VVVFENSSPGGSRGKAEEGFGEICAVGGWKKLEADRPRECLGLGGWGAASACNPTTLAYSRAYRVHKPVAYLFRFFGLFPLGAFDN
jgi:hypothetical protein